MNGELVMRASSEAEPVLRDPRDGDETEVIEKGAEGGETKRAFLELSASGPLEGEETERVQAEPSDWPPPTDLAASDPREGDETEVTERGGGSRRHLLPVQQDPREGDDTTPIRESPLGPPVRV